MARVFFSYAHADEHYRDELETHLAATKREGLIETWHDRQILPGDQFADEIDAELERANIILLLISATFIASEYCFGVELKRAIERHEAGEARVVPVILRPCDWKSSLGRFQAVPRNGKAITTWQNLDEAYFDVVSELRRLLASTPTKAAPTPVQPRALNAASPAAVAAPRSSNLRLRKEFSDLDRDDHLHRAFEYMAQFFESSLAQLEHQNSNVRTRYRRVDANTFTASIYKEGQQAAECAITINGGVFRSGGISYSADVSARGNSFNELLSISNDDQLMFLKPMGMFRGTSQNSKLSIEQAANFYWDYLIARLQ